MAFAPHEAACPSTRMTNPLKTLPRDVLANIRSFASDRVQSHPTAAMIQALKFTHNIPEGTDSRGCFFGACMIVSGGTLSRRARKCYRPSCWLCLIPEHACPTATERSLPTLCRRYTYSDFNEPYSGWSQFTYAPIAGRRRPPPRRVYSFDQEAFL